MFLLVFILPFVMQRTAQQHLSDVADRIDEALARCPVMTEAFIRKVYLEKRSLSPLTQRQQKRLKKEGLKRFFDCFCE